LPWSEEGKELALAKLGVPSKSTMLLAWSKEGKELTLVKLGVPSKSMMLEPLHYDARVLMKDAKVIKVRSTWLMSIKVIKDI
jgi:hypothetical protein